VCIFQSGIEVAAEALSSSTALGTLVSDSKLVAMMDSAQDRHDQGESNTLEDIRRQRLEQLKENAKRSKFGTLMHLTREDFTREVTTDPVVVVSLSQTYSQASVLLDQCLTEIAALHREVKFMSGRADDIVKGYPGESWKSISSFTLIQILPYPR
jgi:hypothetical protein